MKQNTNHGTDKQNHGKRNQKKQSTIFIVSFKENDTKTSIITPVTNLTAKNLPSSLPHMTHKFYITTTLPYVNAQPHMGHTLEFIQADVIARWKRKQLGPQNIIFNVGTDEHGLKIFEKALETQEEKSISEDQKIKIVKKFVNNNVQSFKDFCHLLNISYDSFYRTSDPSHSDVAQSFRNASAAKGDIYKKMYSGYYCVGCESFKTPKELTEDGVCPDHGKAPIKHEEENYFFRLSKQKDALLKHIQDNQDFIIPQSKRDELTNFVQDMNDISISRHKNNLPRGIPVPHDDQQVMYVRFDALTNYVGAIGYPQDQEKMQQFRPGIQLCGPDNLKFQGAIWQGMLASLGLPFSKSILIHGMIFGPDGNKMSKTLGNVISPFDQVEKFGIEALRYYMIAGIPTYGDASYKEDDLINLYNAHLANSFGNLLNRLIHLANKKGISFPTVEQKDTSKIDSDIQNRIIHTQHVVATLYDSYDLYAASNNIHKFVLYTNKYLDEQKPRDTSLPDAEVKETLLTVYYLLSTIIDLYTPIIPSSCAQANLMIQTQQPGILFQKIELT